MLPRGCELFGVESRFEHEGADVVVAESGGFDGFLDVESAVEELVDHLDSGVEYAVAARGADGGDEGGRRRRRRSARGQ